jgi:hypothetical protein
MRRVHGVLRHELPRWNSYRICLVIAICCLAIISLEFQFPISTASQVRQLSPSIEFENMVNSAKVSSGDVSRQDMSGFGSGWSGNAQLLWKAPAPVNKPIPNWPGLTVL